MINLVEPKVEYIKFPWNYTGIDVEHKFDNIVEQMEHCGRICYQSYDKMDSKSGFKFCNHVIKRKHFSVTEFATLDIQLDQSFLESDINRLILDDLFIKYSNLDWDNLILHTTLRDIIRALLDFNKLSFEEDIKEKFLEMFPKVIYLDGDFYEYCSNPTLIWEHYLPQLNDEKKFPKINIKDEENKPFIRFITKFRSHLNFTHQLVRHRTPSYLQLSRRYVRVDEKLDLIDPRIVYNFTDEETNSYIKVVEKSLEEYRKLLKNHRPEVARIVLPTGIMTEILVLEYFHQWKWIWSQRTSPHADVMMRYMMTDQIEYLSKFLKI